MDYSTLGDEELINLVAQEDKKALSALYDRYGGMVYSLSLRIMEDQGIAEEVTQDVFLTLWGRANSFHATRGKFASWLLAITHNRAIDVIRRKRHLTTQSLDNTPEGLLGHQNLGSITGSDPGEGMESGEVREAVERLPTPQREVIELSYFAGLTQSEIAQRLSLPLGTVKTRLRLALHKLKENLSDASKKQGHHDM